MFKKCVLEILSMLDVDGVKVIRIQAASMGP